MQAFSLTIRQRLREYARPAVMGILNATPDSFYAGSRATAEADICRRAGQLVADGADIIDVGACSTRPGGATADAATEAARLAVAIPAVRRAVGDGIPVSVDTFRAGIARRAVEEWGADIVNDVSGGTVDSDMFATVARLHVPYVLMHMRGTPQTMAGLTDYDDVTAEVVADLTYKISALEDLGVADIIVDPGFGFAKTPEQNYSLLAHLETFALLRRPVLVGVSRKSMLSRLPDMPQGQELTATAIVNALALERGAAILRVHDPKEALTAIAIAKALADNT